MIIASTPIFADTPCVRCGYNLRSLRPEQPCPECGLGVARSLALGQELRDSRPGWIASLAWGAALLLLAQPMAFFGFLAAEVIGLFSRHWYVDGIVAGTCLLLAATLHCVGCWLLTRPENPHAIIKPHRSLTIPLRICCLGPLLSAGMALTSALLVWWWFRNNRFVFWPNWLRDTTRFINAYAEYPLFLFVPCPLLQFILLRRLAVRVLDRHLFEHATIVGCGFPLTALLLFFWPHLNLNDLAGYCIVLAIWVAFGLFWLWSLYVLALSARAFFRAAREARCAWRQADGARLIDSPPV